MSTLATIPPSLFADPTPEELEADTNAIIAKLTSGTQLDAATYTRIRERADQIRDDVFRKHGLLDIGVPAVRELREGA